MIQLSRNTNFTYYRPEIATQLECEVGSGVVPQTRGLDVEQRGVSVDRSILISPAFSSKGGDVHTSTKRRGFPAETKLDDWIYLSFDISKHDATARATSRWCF